MGVSKTNSSKETREFIGRAWKHTANCKNNQEVEFLNITIDRGITLNDIDQTYRMQLWPNTKREGKKDADYRLSILIPEK